MERPKNINIAMGNNHKDFRYTDSAGSQKIKSIRPNFHWDYKKIWNLDIPTDEIDINKLIWHFDYPFWDTDEIDDFNLTPWQVINNSSKYTTHYSMIQKSDLKYPIGIMEKDGRWVILDGIHRLVKAYLAGDEQIKVRVIPHSLIPEITSDNNK